MAFESRDPFLIRQVCAQICAMCLFAPLLNYRLFFSIYLVLQPLFTIVWLILNMQEREEPTLTEWDRFARREYIRLSMEEDAEDASNGSADVWDESLESPF